MNEVFAVVDVCGMTVDYRVRRCYEVIARDWVLWHAAAGSVGTIAIEWLKTHAFQRPTLRLTCRSGFASNTRNAPGT
jgi:NADPH:quinone reductase-like Zn-dependent oxidoreductase